MPETILIADSGATKAEWALVSETRALQTTTAGISPYFLEESSIVSLLKSSLKPNFLKAPVSKLFFYGTGCASISNARMVNRALKSLWPKANIQVKDDLLGATRALCGNDPGIACILGTGSSSASYNGKRIIDQRPGLGYVLGDEGSGSYLGKKLIQYYLYDLFDKELKIKFQQHFNMDRSSILEAVYKRPNPSRFLASFAPFLSENRGHYMVENILEDGLQDFFFNHIRRYKTSGKFPLHFTGTISYVFRDCIQQLCTTHGYHLGKILQKPMPGLIRYHKL